MLYIPLAYVKPDMVLAKDIPSPNGLFSLLNKGQSLTAAHIAKLHSFEIDGVYIENELSEDIEPENLLEPDERRSIMTDLRAAYISIASQPYLSPAVADSTKALATSIVDKLLDREEILMDIMEIKSYDNYTYSHSMNVCILSVLIGRQYGLSLNRLTDIALCGLLHDIGKVDIPISIINKRGPLTDEEYEIVKAHPSLGVGRMRKCYNISREVLEGIQCHHEKFDGSGYPYKYKGERIPLFARILSLADVYDALTSQRSYRGAWLPCDAIEYIMAQADIQFDREIIRHFLHIVCAYPTGTIVRLSDGSLAVVVSNHPENVLRPTVRLMNDCSLGKKMEDINLLEDPKFLNITVSAMLGSSYSTESEAVV